MQELETRETTEEPVLEKVLAEQEEVIEEPKTKITIEDLEEKANELLFEYLKEIELAEQGNLNSEKLQRLILEIQKLKEQHQDNQEYQKSIDDCIERMKFKLSNFVKKAPEVIKDEELDNYQYL